MTSLYKVLSIQSHVVSGYVGNKSATFPLQVLGFEVDAINTVQFSNHTGYGKFRGQAISEHDFDNLITGLRENDILDYTHVLTGYCRSPELLSKIGKFVQELKKINPNLIYVCDPVMGDDNALYVPEEILPIYANEIVPLANVICPNQFEAEILTKGKITDRTSLLKTINTLHEKGVETVVISSSDLGLEKHLLGIASTTVGKQRKVVGIDIPKFDVMFIGTGDLFASLMLAWITLSNNDVKLSLEKTIATIQGVLSNTAKLFQNKNLPITCKEKELKLIQSKAIIENPVIELEAKIFME